jgi:hypothetical protein
MQITYVSSWEGLDKLGCTALWSRCLFLGPGRLDIFVKAVPGDIDQKWFDNGQWYEWEPLGNSPGDHVYFPTAVSWGNGRIDIFARG